MSSSFVVLLLGSSAMNDRLQYVICDGLGITVDASGSASLSRELADWLTPFAGKGGVRRPLLEVQDAAPAGDESFYGGGVNTDGTVVRVKDRSLVLEFSVGTHGGSFGYRLSSGATRFNPVSFLRRMVNGEGSPEIAKALSYHGLWSVLHLALLRANHGFVHGGCVVDRAGRSRLLVGAGGSGKTSATLALVERHGWLYQAEDLALLDSSGRTYLSPRPLTVYHSDVRWGNPVLRTFEATLPRGEKLAWQVAALVKRNPRRRVRFDRLFRHDQVCGTAAQLHTVYFVRRTFKPTVLDATEIPVSAIVEHVLAVSMRELAALYEPLMQAQGMLGPEMKHELRLESVFHDTRMLYRQALDGIRCIRVTASYDTKPSEIADLVVENG